MAKAATTKKPSKSAQAREYKKANPTASTQEVADHLKMSYNAVYQALAGKKKKAGKKRGRPAGSKTKAKARSSSNGHSGLLGAAEHFIKEAGSAVHAREFLERLSKMFAK